MIEDVRNFAYLACDDLEDWLPGNVVDYWDETHRCRFRRIYPDGGAFFIHYSYRTTTMQETGKLCMIPDIFWSDHPENILEDLTETARYIIEVNGASICVLPYDHDENMTVLSKIQERIPGSKIDSIYGRYYLTK